MRYQQKPSMSQTRDVMIADAAQRLRRMRRLLVLIGAGASADAGVPTFRGSGGYWRHYRHEDLASPDGFRRDPELVWDWYRERRLQIAECEPHAGQRAIALLQRHFNGHVLVATTNEDDLLERAGVEHVVSLHGNCFATMCSAGCGWQARDDADNSLSFLACPRCGSAVRPGSIWFGEAVPASPLEHIERFDAEAALVIGSSSLVRPVAEIAPEMALAGRPVVEINAEETPPSALALHICGNASDILPRLVDLMTSRCVVEQERKRGPR